MGWHLYVGTYNPSGTLMGNTMDANTLTTQTGALGAAPLSTDGMWIRANTKVAVAHLAYFPRVLTQVEINSVGSLVAQWPLDMPINWQPTAPSTTVDLTPVLTDTGQIKSNQATFMPQIANTNTIVPQIKTSTDTLESQQTTLINTTLPSLNDLLNSIYSGIQATIAGVGGSFTKTLGQLFSGWSVDSLVESDLGSACAPDIIDVGLSGFEPYSLELQCLSYADWYTFTGPADDYTIESLGTLEIWRGGYLVLRHGLHTVTHMVDPVPGIPEGSFHFDFPGTPPAYLVRVTPAPETCWKLIAVHVP
jgi:hypothetical protein